MESLASNSAVKVGASRTAVRETIMGAQRRLRKRWRLAGCAGGGAPLVLMGVVLLTGCGQAADAADCRNNVASVGGASITQGQYKALLHYTLAYYERANPRSSYYGRKICGDKTLVQACTSIKRSLLQRMIDQQVVTAYATTHHLMPSAADWSRALSQERQLVRRSGGSMGFSAYLAKLGTDQAQFRWIESQQLETAKVMRSIGAWRFKAWLRNQERRAGVTRCTLSGL